jgi:hypothetical protein
MTSRPRPSTSHQPPSRPSPPSKTRPGPRRQREHRLPVTPQRPHTTMSAAHHARLAARLTPRDRWLLEMLHEHRVLTTDTITTMAFPSGRAARLRLLRLYEWDVVDRFQPRLRSGAAPMHYVLGGAGAAVLAALSGVSLTALGYRREDVLAVAHHHTLAHTVAINDLFAQLVAHTVATLDSPGRTSRESVLLLEWWSQWRCQRLVGDLVRPDAYARITVPTASVTGAMSRASAAGTSGAARTGRAALEFEWFLEFDFGTSTLATLAGKVARYARLAGATGAPTPVLLWLPGTRRETSARETLARALHRLDRPDLVPLATTAPFDGHGPRNNTAQADPELYRHPAQGVTHDTARMATGSWFDPTGRIWLPVQAQGAPRDRTALTPAAESADRSCAGSSRRLTLAELATRWPAQPHLHPALTQPSAHITLAQRPNGDPHDLAAAGRNSGARVDLVAPDPIPPPPHTYTPNLPPPPRPTRERRR